MLNYQRVGSLHHWIWGNLKISDVKNDVQLAPLRRFYRSGIGPESDPGLLDGKGGNGLQLPIHLGSGREFFAAGNGHGKHHHMYPLVI